MKKKKKIKKRRRKVNTNSVFVRPVKISRQQEIKDLVTGQNVKSN